MKSNEEFIAGIYEKAAVYKEENKTKIIRVDFAAKAARIAAMVVLCLGLAGVGTMTLGRQRGNAVSMEEGEKTNLLSCSFKDIASANSALSTSEISIFLSSFTFIAGSAEI